MARRDVGLLTVFDDFAEAWEYCQLVGEAINHVYDDDVGCEWHDDTRWDWQVGDVNLIAEMTSNPNYPCDEAYGWSVTRHTLEMAGVTDEEIRAYLGEEYDRTYPLDFSL